jgi:hypothetical protein
MITASRFAALFWAWYIVTAALCLALPEGRVFTGAIGMSVFWGLLLKFRNPLQTWVERIPGPLWVHFFVVGVLSADVVMENLAINFHGDLHSDLALNSILWLGTYLGWLVGWWIVGRFYWFEPRQVFFLAGAMGILVEHNWMVPKLLASGQWLPAIVSAPILIPVYGGAIAPAFLLTQRAPSGPTPKPGIVGFLFALFLPVGAFYVGGALWLAVIRPLFAKLHL